MSSELGRQGADSSGTADRPTETAGTSTGTESRPAPAADAGNAGSRLDSYARRDTPVSGTVDSAGAGRDSVSAGDAPPRPADAVPAPGDSGHVPVPDRGRPQAGQDYGSEPGGTAGETGIGVGSGSGFGEGQAASGPAAGTGTELAGETRGLEALPEPAVGEAGTVPGDGTAGFAGDRFTGQEDREPGAFVPEFAPGPSDGTVDGKPGDVEPGFYGRAGETQDQSEVTAGSGEQRGGEGTGPGTRTNADSSAQPREGQADTTTEKDAEGQDTDGQQRPKDLAPVQHPEADAETGTTGDTPAVAAAEATPDRQPDETRLARMEAQMDQMLAAVRGMKEELDASRMQRAEEKAAFEQEIGELRSKNSELEQKVADLEDGRGPQRTASDSLPDASGDPAQPEAETVTEPVTRPDSLVGDDDKAGETADILGRANDEPEVAGDKTEPSPDRSALEATGSAGMGLAGQFGMVHPALSLVMGGETAARAFSEMSPDEQLDAMNTMNGIVNAYGGMSPGTAFLAAVTSAYGPAMYSRAKDAAHDLLHKMRRED